MNVKVIDCLNEEFVVFGAREDSLNTRLVERDYLCIQAKKTPPAGDIFGFLRICRSVLLQIEHEGCDCTRRENH